jgi:hypothetical protein
MNDESEVVIKSNKGASEGNELLSEGSQSVCVGVNKLVTN